MLEMKFPIRSLDAPGAQFTGRKALRDCRRDRDATEKYEQFVNEFITAVEQGEDIELAAALLSEDLSPLGYSDNDVRWHVENFGSRIRQGYAHMADLRE